jgi:predicted nucleic acid-binding protein
MADTPNRPLFGRFLDNLRSDPRALVVSTTDELFDRGVDLYEARPDKRWSLTDCISFVVMRERGISEALTGDHHSSRRGL